MDYLKAEQLSSSKWRVCALPFYGPLDGKDTDGEYFSPRTDPKPGWYKERPVLFHHTQDELVGDDAIGVEGELVKEKDGWWAEMWLERSNRYWTHINSLLARGKMYGSSGALGHAVKRAPDGELLVWPHVEQTLTPTPANPYARIMAAKALGSFRMAGIELDSDQRTKLDSVMDELEDLHADLSLDGEAAAARRIDELQAFLERARKGSPYF